MELIERYIYAVGKRLPRKQRADIEKELKSLIMDELDERTGGREPGYEDIAAVLKEMGSPAEVAARYTEKGRYLIGPALYPFYTMVAGIVAGALLLGLTISTILGLLQGQYGTDKVLQQVGLLVLRFITAAATGLGFLTFIFAVIERFMPEKEIQSFHDGDDWDPKDLPPVPEKYDVMKPGEQILGIVLAVAAIVVFNAFPQVIAIYCAGEGSCIPMLSQQALHHYLPFWNVVWGLSIGKDGLLLYRGRWELGTHIYDIVLSLLTIAVLAIMITGPRLLNQTAIDMLQGAAGVDIAQILRYALIGAFCIAIIATAVETVVKVFRLIRDRTQSA
jgi:hypothetical protein